ncbi:uracil-xanthine permease family protein [Natrialba chahannaoensis]|uniref:uracil-xanthine permease family protein n=1 Tax=Natrialba chahannaoensis TaxID=68911 RepID=UPI000A042ADA|nr:nucleobase:cation symporter-2 family protein [Natrialba chahannaoensis]
MSSPSSSEEGFAEYRVEDKPPLQEAIPLGFQHVFAMFLGNVAPPLILATTLGLPDGETTFLVQMALIVAGVATLVQVFTIGPVGARLPIVMGTSFAFLGPVLNIGTEFGIAAVFGAALVGAVIEVVFGFSIRPLRPYFPPLVTGIVIILIGITLIPTGMDYAAGGAESENYGAMINLGLAFLVLVVTIYCNQFLEGILKLAAVFVGIVVGYVVAIPLGLVDFSPVANAGWVTVPVPLKYGISFEPSAIILIAFIYVVVGVETLGNIGAIVEVEGRSPKERELSGGIMADGFASAFAAIFNALPNTAFAQNVGLINLTGVASRYVAGIGGIILVLFGFVPKIGAVIAAMPDAVLGGGALIMFAMVLASGFSIVHNNVELTHRNMTILAVSIGLGVAVSTRPEALAQLPSQLELLLEEGILVGGVSALVLNVVLPGGGVGIGPTDETAGRIPTPGDRDQDKKQGDDKPAVGSTGKPSESVAED